LDPKTTEERLTAVEIKQQQIANVVIPAVGQALTERLARIENRSEPNFFEKQLLDGQKEIRQELSTMRTVLTEVKAACHLNCGDGGRVDRVISDVDALNAKVDDISADNNKAKGIGVAVLFIGGLLQGVVDWVLMRH